MAKAVELTKPFVPRMVCLSADDLEAIRQEIIRQARQAAADAAGPRREEWLGIIVNSAYADERYAVKRAAITNAAGDEDSQLTVAALAVGDPYYLAVTAANRAELPAHSHLLPDGAIVWIRKSYGLETPPVGHYHFSHAVPSVAHFKISTLTPLKGKVQSGWDGAPGNPTWSATETNLVHVGSGCVKLNDIFLAASCGGYWAFTSIYARLKADPA